MFLLIIKYTWWQAQEVLYSALPSSLFIGTDLFTSPKNSAFVLLLQIFITVFIILRLVFPNPLPGNQTPKKNATSRMRIYQFSAVCSVGKSDFYGQILFSQRDCCPVCYRKVLCQAQSYLPCVFSCGSKWQSAEAVAPLPHPLPLNHH